MQFYLGVGWYHGLEMSVSGVTTICLLMNQDPGEDDTLDRRLRQRVPMSAKIQQLQTTIEEEWAGIPQATINNLINSV